MQKKPITVKYEPVVEVESPVDGKIVIEEVPVEEKEKEKKQKERKCRICKRQLPSADDKYLCPDCKNTYGSIGAAAAVVGVGAIIKYREPIIKAAKASIKIVKNRF